MRETEPSEQIRVAAAGDVHCRESRRAQVEQAFAQLPGKVDLVLLAGDLTSTGEPGEARILAEACRGLDLPVVAVLGNHDWHAGKPDEVSAILSEAGVAILDREARVLELGGTEVGVVGAKGFVGGFPGSHLTDFG